MKPQARLARTPISTAVAAALAGLLAGPALAAPLALSNVPLFLTSNTKANVLMLYGNSNSMDGDATGAAVGSTDADSKSEIARAAIKTVISNYPGTINMGLLAYQQYLSGGDRVDKRYLSNAQYDVSYNPSNYNASYAGARNGTTKRYRAANPSSPGNYIYYNIVLPSYSTSNSGNMFCYSTSACTDPTHDFKGKTNACSVAEDPGAGPWDSYDCYGDKTGTSDAAPSANNSGYSRSLFSTVFEATDSDLGQGITDFGKRLAQQYVSLAWFSNASPGGGYLHVPIAALDSTQAGKLNVKLGVSQFNTNSPVAAGYPLQNAGLSPLEGTVLTANKYFNGTLTDTNQGGPVAAPPNSCGKNFLVMLTDGLPSVDKDGNPSANVTTNLANLSTQVTAAKTSAATVQTYVVGFALPFGVNPAQLDTIAQAGGTGTSYSASDPASLNAAFSTIFGDIVHRTSAASAVALNSQSVTTDTSVYQARFSSGEWSGQLLSFPVSANGTLGTRNWDAGQLLNALAPTNRVILTYKPSTRAGIPFRWPALPATPALRELDLTQIAALNTAPNGSADTSGSARLNYLRGDPSNEGTSGLKFRARPTSKLGDIVNSAPNYVGAPSLNSAATGYAAFRTAQLNRTRMVYVGANDGMLHGFDATTGQEKLAYVPSRVFGNLTQLTSPTYSHLYFVDGTPSSNDVYYGSAWHTILTGSMGNGGRGIFGLDVTNPSTFTEANAASIVKFEYTDVNDPDVGYVTGPISIVKLNNGKTAAIFGNGYNSTGTGTAALFIVDVETGSLIKKITVGTASAATPNALAAPAVVDIDGNQTADVVYAGDLQGNMYKFDLSAAAPASWSASYTLYAAGQPITAAPEVGKRKEGGYIVYFGTGKYVESADNSSTAANAFYAVWDEGVAVTSISSLQQQTVTGVRTISGVRYRDVSQTALNWASKKGWYLNLPTTGERSVIAPVMHNDRIIFTTTIPSTALCSYGGSSWLMELDAQTGKMLTEPPFDTNNDGVVDGRDSIVGGRGDDTLQSGAAIVGLGGGPEKKLANSTSGNIIVVSESGSSKPNRRVSWRQLK